MDWPRIIAVSIAEFFGAQRIPENYTLVSSTQMDQ